MVLAALKTALAQPDVAKLMKAARDAFTFAELEQVVRETLGGKELDIFMELDEGEILRRETGKDMVNRVPYAESDAPATVRVDARSNGVRVPYDEMACRLVGYGNPDARASCELDAKIETLFEIVPAEEAPLALPLGRARHMP
jgi:hypothetical protein